MWTNHENNFMIPARSDRLDRTARARAVTEVIVRFADLLLVSLLVGSMFGIWIGFNPADLSAAAYVEQQQHEIRALNVLLPALGVICTGLTAALALLSADDARARRLLLAAVVCLVVAGAITRIVNQPINAEIAAWSIQAPPESWTQFRDCSWHWHIARTLAGILALSLLIWTVAVRRAGSSRSA